MPAKRVLYLHSLSHMGGGETTLYALLTHLDKKRYEPALLVPEKGPLTDLLEKAGIKTFATPFPRGFFRGYPPGFSLSALGRMKAIARGFNPDLIHVNDSYLMLYAGLIGRELHIPVVLTGHGWWDAHFVHQDYINKLFAKKVCCVSRTVRDGLIKRGFVKEDRTTVTYLGIDTERFKPAPPEERRKIREELGVKEGEVVITTVGRFTLRKGFEEFFLAGARILAQERNVRFLVVGDKIFNIWEETDEVKRRITGFVQSDPRLKEKTLFTGFRNDTERILWATDIFVSSAWWESLGVAIMEGMSCGLPVVSTNVGGPAETVVDGQTGFLVPPKDANILAEKILELIRSPQLRARMGQAGRERVISEYSLTRYVERIQTVYDNMLE